MTGIFTFCAIKLIGIFTYSVTRKLVQFSCEGVQMVCIYRFSPVIFTCSGSTSSTIISSALLMSYLILCHTAMHDVMNMILQRLFCYLDINFLDHLISILSFEGALWIFFSYCICILAIESNSCSLCHISFTSAMSFPCLQSSFNMSLWK